MALAAFSSPGSVPLEEALRVLWRSGSPGNWPGRPFHGNHTPAFWDMSQAQELSFNTTENQELLLPCYYICAQEYNSVIEHIPCIYVTQGLIPNNRGTKKRRETILFLCWKKSYKSLKTQNTLAYTVNVPFIPFYPAIIICSVVQF